ncbi:MAG: PQQ-binding-like beta-propeller repeat protein [Myxococcales bacterium]|nr:PQQ-binding-like beta-propeller repeat protein [Myxococcales bacterium]
MSSAAAFLALVADVRARLEAHPDTFTLQHLSGARATEADLAAVEARLGVSLPPLLRALHLEVGAPFGLYWQVREGGTLDADDAPSGQLELVATDQLSFHPPRVLRFTNDGYGNGFALDYRKKGAPKLAFFDHDEEKLTPRKEKTLDALFAAWAEVLFVNTETEPLDVDPVLELVWPEKAQPWPEKKPAPPGFVTLPFPPERCVGGVDFDGDRLFVSTYEGEVLVFDLATGALVSTQAGLPSLRAIARLPDGRLLASSDAFGVFALPVDGAGTARTPWRSERAAALRVLGDEVLVSGDARGCFVDPTGKVRCEFPVPKGVVGVAVFPDRIVLAGDDEIACLDRATGARRWADATPTTGALFARGDDVSLVLVGGGLVTWGRDGKRIGKAPRKPKAHFSVVQTADRIVAARLGTLEVLDHSGKSLSQRAFATEADAVRVHLHPDGRRLLVRTDDALHLTEIERL